MILACPFCGEAPKISTGGSCIDFECCHSGMSFQKSDYLTIEQRETWSNDSFCFGVEAEAVAMVKAIEIWNTRPESEELKLAKRRIAVLLAELENARSKHTSKKMLEKHYAIRSQIAKDEMARADGYENDLIRINGIVYAAGLRLGSDEYFIVRGMCAEAQRNKEARLKK